MRHPFESLTSKRYWTFFWLLFAATLIMVVVESALGKPLQDCRTATGGKCDIVSFEVAGTLAHSRGIVDAWTAANVMGNAKWNTWLDYLFMLCYPNLVALGIAGVLHFPMSGAWRGIGRFLAWAQWLVFASDASENVALLRMLYGGVGTPWPQMALVCATLKFSFLGAGLFYLLVTLLRRIRIPTRLTPWSGPTR